MDRVLSRRSSAWQSINSTFMRSFANKTFTDKKSTPKVDSKSRRLSIRDETLLKIFSSEPDQPLNDENVHPIHMFRSFSQPAETEKYALNVDIYMKSVGVDDDGNCQPVANRTAHESANVQNSEVMPATPPIINLPPSAENAISRDKALQSRLQRDLNSPSANARIRAMKALKSPTMKAYAHFDVPHEEQDIITDEERKSPKSIQEVMKDVVVYVEVRTGEDNRSAGVKQVISQLGAKVNDKFLRDTTHVVFKDGLQSTYNKAKKWNIPIVSILWIEACKKHTVLMNPKLYPISNIDRYENPDMYAKIKRQKSMQPDAEENARRHKVKLPGLANKTDNVKEAVKVSTKKISLPRKPKDNLNEILTEFKEKILSTPEDSEGILRPKSKILERIKNSPALSGKKQPTKTDSLKKYAVLDSNIEEEAENSDDDFEVQKPIPKPSAISAKRSLIFGKKTSPSAKKRQSVVTSPKKRVTTTTSQSNTSRRSIGKRGAAKSETSASQKSVQSSQITKYFTVAPAKSNNKTSKSDEQTNATEKTAILGETCDMDETRVEDSSISDQSGNPDTKLQNTEMQLDIVEESSRQSTTTPNCELGKRRTVFTPQTMIQTPIRTADIQNSSKIAQSTSRRRTCFNFATPNPLKTLDSTPTKASEKDNPNDSILVTDNCLPSIRKSVRRRTIFTPSYHDESSNAVQEATTLSMHSAVKPVNLFAAGTPTPKAGTILDELSNIHEFSSTKTPVNPRRRTVFDISMDIIDKRLHNINKSAKQSRYSEFGAKDHNGSIDQDQTITEIPPSKNTDRHEEVDKVHKLSDQDSRQTSQHTFNSALNTDSFKTSTKLDFNNTVHATTTAQPKKRKLFAPTELIFSTPPAMSTSQKDGNPTNEIDGNVKKKAKTDIKPVKAVRGIGDIRKKTIGSTASRSQKRRSTLDFEQVKSLNRITETQRSKQATQSKMNYLVCTNMHTEQMNFVKRAIQELGRFKLENTVSNHTTHVVSLEPRRTFNLLRGIVRGLWIVSYTWVLESVECGKWLFEEPYEMINFSRGVEICRSQRQAFGRHYKIDIFADLAPIFVSPKSKVPPKNIEELIVLCSGTVVKDKMNAKYILGESMQENPDKICLDPIWILDCIQDNQLKKTRNYMITI